MPKTFQVEKLMDMKMDGKKKLFLVKWKGYPASQNTWEPVAHLGECKDMMAAFDKKEEAAPPKKRGRPPKAAEPPAKKAKTAPPKKEKAAPPPKEEKKSILFDIKEIGAMLMASITGKKPEKPAKAEKAKPPPKEPKKPKKEEGAVVEVDKIVGMRYRTKGGVQYCILWKDGSKSWEKEDNVLDDDLIDEYEQEEQMKVYGEASISVGTEVEVKNVDEGFANSWSDAVVKKKEKGGKFTVEYSGFVDDDGEGMSESGLPRNRLRVAPDGAPKGWAPAIGEIVEINEDDCWWEARVLKEVGKNKFEVMFRVSDEKKPMTLSKKVRPCSWLQMSK